MTDFIGFNIQDKEVLAVLTSAQRFADDPRRMHEEIGQRYERRVLENFAAESDPEGNPWRRLSATTMMMRLARGKRLKKKGTLSKKGREYLQNKRLLVESGALRGAIHYQAGASGVLIGVGGHIPYAAIQQRGGQAGRGKKVTIPARAYLAMNDGENLALAERDRQMVLQIGYRHLEAALLGRS